MCVLIVIAYLTQDHCLQFPTPVVFKEVNVVLGFMSGIMGALEGGVVSVADPIYKKCHCYMGLSLRNAYTDTAYVPC